MAICVCEKCEARVELRVEGHRASEESGRCPAVAAGRVERAGGGEGEGHLEEWSLWSTTTTEAAASWPTERPVAVAAAAERGDELTWVICEEGKAIPHCISKRRVLAEFETIYPLTSSSHPHVPRPHTLPSSASSSRMQDRRNVH